MTQASRARASRQRDPGGLSCLAIAAREDAPLSLRDLRAEHLPLLRAMRDVAVPALLQRYGLAEDQLVAYFHYPPSFPWLHLHLRHLSVANLGLRTHALDQVIHSIEVCGDYYDTVPLLIVEGDERKA